MCSQDDRCGGVGVGFGVLRGDIVYSGDYVGAEFVWGREKYHLNERWYPGLAVSTSGQGIGWIAGGGKKLHIRDVERCTAEAAMIQEYRWFSSWR